MQSIGLTAASILAFTLVACTTETYTESSSGQFIGDIATPAAISPSISLGACTVGLRVSPGSSCRYSGGTFWVRRADGYGCMGGSICAEVGVTINSFSASKISGSRDWRIDSL